MKIAPVGLYVRNLGVSSNINHKKTNNYSDNTNSSVVSYLDIPFTSIFMHESLYVKGAKAIVAEVEAQREVKEASQHAFLLLNDAQAQIDDVVDKIKRTKRSGFLTYHDINGNIVRSFKHDGKNITSMKEYENGNKVRKTKVFDDGSIKIHDYVNDEIIYASPDYKLTSFEKTSKNSVGTSVTEKIFADEFRFKYTHVEKQLGKPAIEDSFVYFDSLYDNKTNLIFYKNIVGKQELKPKNCEYVISFQKDKDSDAEFSTLLYLSGLKLSSSSKNYTAKSGLFHTFDGVIQNTKDICPGVISIEPVTYNENIKLPENFDFIRGANIESEVIAMYKDGDFNKLPF